METLEEIPIGSLWEYMPPKLPHCPVLNKVVEIGDHVTLESLCGRAETTIATEWLFDAYVRWAEPEGAKKCLYCGHNHIIE
jgi:hypothetical protein